MAAEVTDPGSSWIGKQTKACLKKASATETFGCVGKNFRATLSTNPRCAAHDGRVGCALPIMYCADFWHTLRSQNNDQMSQLIFNVAGDRNSVTDFFSQQELITVAQAMQRLPDCILCHLQAQRYFRAGRRVFFIGEQLFQRIK